MGGSALLLSLLIGSWTVRSASSRAPQIQSIRWVGRLSLLGTLASGASCAAAAIAWIPLWDLTRDVRGPAEAIAAISLLFALGAVVGFVGRVGAIIGAPWMKASRRTLRIAWFAAIVSGILLPLREYQPPAGSLSAALLRAIPVMFLSAAATVPLAWTALMLSVAAPIDARLRVCVGMVPRQPVLLAAAVACAVTLVNWRVGVHVDHAHQVGAGAGPVVAWMVVLAPGAAAWIAACLARSIGLGVACGLGVASAAMVWAIAA
jgi:hypothetical protein